MPGIDRKEVQLTFLRFVGELREVNTYYSDPDPSIQQMRSDDENTFDGLDTEVEDNVVFEVDKVDNEVEDKVEDKVEDVPEQKEIIVKVKSAQFKIEKTETVETQSCCSGVALDKYISQPTEDNDLEEESLAKLGETSQPIVNENASEENSIEQEQIDTVSVDTEEIKSSQSQSQDSITIPSSQGSPKAVIEKAIKKKGLKKKLFSLFKRRK